MTFVLPVAAAKSSQNGLESSSIKAIACPELPCMQAQRGQDRLLLEVAGARPGLKSSRHGEGEGPHLTSEPKGAGEHAGFCRHLHALSNGPAGWWGPGAPSGAAVLEVFQHLHLPMLRSVRTPACTAGGSGAAVSVPALQTSSLPRLLGWQSSLNHSCSLPGGEEAGWEGSELGRINPLYSHIGFCKILAIEEPIRVSSSPVQS